MISLADSELLQPHPEDPVRENPYPTNHPSRRVWEMATHEAEEDLFRFQQKMLESRTLSGENQDWHIELIFGKFQIWAKRGLSVVRSRTDARSYEGSLEFYVQSWLTLMEEKCSEFGLRPETFLTELKAQLLRAAKYWSGNALESVRTLRKDISDDVAASNARADQSQPIESSPQYGGNKDLGWAEPACDDSLDAEASSVLAGAATHATPTPAQSEDGTNGTNTGPAVTSVQVEVAPLDPVATGRQAMVTNYKSEVRKVTGKALTDAAIYSKLPHKDAKGQFISWKFNKSDSKNSDAFDASVRRMICEDKPHVKKT